MARGGHALDRLGELPGDLGLLGVPEVQAVREPERLAAHARDVPRRLENRQRPAEEGVEARDAALAVERDGEPPERGPEPEDCSVEPWPAHGSRADQLVVAAKDESAAAHVRRRQELQKRLRRRWTDDLASRNHRPRLEREVVARALVRQETCRYLPHALLVPEGAELSACGDLAHDRVVELPAIQDHLDRLEHLRSHDRHHPLLAFGDHHLPGLHTLFAKRDAVEMDVDAVVRGHLRERRGETGGSADEHKQTDLQRTANPIRNRDDCPSDRSRTEDNANGDRSRPRVHGLNL